MEQELRTAYRQRFYQSDYNSYVDGLKKEYNFVQSADGVSAWNSSLDTTKTTDSETWDSSFTAAARAKELFTFAGQKITIDSVIHRVKGEKDLQGLPLALHASSARIFEKISNNLLIEIQSTKR